MSNDLTYKYRKDEINKYGSYYFKKGFGMYEKPILTPYEYGSIKIGERRRKKRWDILIIFFTENQ